MKWVSLCRNWLNENAPCGKLEALQGIAALMPLGVRRHGQIASRNQLACEAMRRVYGVAFADLPQWLSKPPGRTKRMITGVTSTIYELSQRECGVTYGEIKKMKNAATLAMQLVKKGVLRRDGDVFYCAAHSKI